jgi:hypothetical protein
MFRAIGGADAGISLLEGDLELEDVAVVHRSQGSLTLMKRLAIYCADVGSIKQGNFGWARVEVRRRRRTGPATCPAGRSCSRGRSA